LSIYILVCILYNKNFIVFYCKMKYYKPKHAWVPSILLVLLEVACVSGELNTNEVDSYKSLIIENAIPLYPGVGSVDFSF